MSALPALTDLGPFEPHDRNPYNAHMGTNTTKTLRVRIKDKHVPLLRRMAREVNIVWNYCNQANSDHWRKHRRHLTGFDLNKLCTGSGPAFDLIGDSTIQEVGQHYASKRMELPRFRGQFIAWHSSRLLVAPLEV